MTASLSVKQARLNILQAYLKDKKNIDKRNALVQCHSGLIFYVIRMYGHLAHIDEEEAFNEGVLGLIEAADRFGSSHGTEFSTYAMWWVKSRVQNHVTDERQQQYCRPKTHVNPSRTHYHEKVGKTLDPLQSKCSLAAPVKGSPSGATFGDSIPSDELGPDMLAAASDTRRRVHSIIRKVLDGETDQRLHTIIEKRILAEDPLSLVEVGKLVNLSREMVRQHEMRIMNAIEKVARARGVAA